jgi:hypothetical protein
MAPTNFVVNFDFVHQKLLKLADLHDLIFHGLCAINDEAKRFFLSLQWGGSRLLAHSHDDLQQTPSVRDNTRALNNPDLARLEP